MNKVGNLRPVKLGDTEYFIHPYSSSSGFPFVLSNEDFKLNSEFNNPSVSDLSSQALWRQSASTLHDKFVVWAMSVGCEMQQPKVFLGWISASTIPWPSGTLTQIRS